MGVIFMGVVGIKISKRGERRKYLPLEIRAKMYEDVIELKRQGLKPSQIQEKLFEKYKEQISIQNIYNWINGKHYPFGSINKFDEKPSPELAYIIGVIFSDGYKYIDNNWHYYLRLDVKDKEFAEEFGEKLARVLQRKKPYKPSWNTYKKLWTVVGYCIQLYDFLNKPLKELKSYIEYNKNCVSSFLQALFNGEGTIPKHTRMLRLCNTNKELLNYVQYLLKKYFDIDTTGPHLARKKGNIMRFPNGITTKTTEDYYYIYIRAKSLLNFYKYIGFTIKRKQQRLIKAIQ
jgi:intein-encoded DNA endonuclease-like protein